MAINDALPLEVALLLPSPQRWLDLTTLFQIWDKLLQFQTMATQKRHRKCVESLYIFTATPVKFSSNVTALTQGLHLCVHAVAIRE